MTSRQARSPLALALALALGATAGAPAVARVRPASIDLSPAQARGIAKPHIGVGPFGIHNLTGQAYSLTVFPVLLGQQTDGSIYVREDGASLATARSLISSTLKSADFPPGQSLPAGALVHRIPAMHSLYGGLLFQATPVNRRTQIVAVLRLDGRILLDPPPALRHVRFTARRIRPEQAGPQRLEMFVPISNRGNYFVNATGALTVSDSSGAIVAQGPLNRVQVLPRATVELTAPISAVLPAGVYHLRARMRAGGTHFDARGIMRLFGPSEVATPKVSITAFPTPSAHTGRDAEITVIYANTGNVPLTPGVDFQVRPMTSTGVGRISRTVPARARMVAPGQRGTASATYHIPSDGRPFQLTARLKIDRRVVDRRSVSVTPTAAPSPWQSFKNFLSDHALLVISLLTLALAASIAWSLLRRQRRR